MIEDAGIDNVQIKNYSIPGLTWSTAHIDTQGFLIGGKVSPLKALRNDGGCDLLLVMLGVNDRKNVNALADAKAFFEKINTPVILIAQVFGDDVNGEAGNVVVSRDEWLHMKSIYNALGVNTVWINLWKLYKMGFQYDKLHPTDSGKQWIAASVYMALSASLNLTPIVRNIAWLWSLGWKSESGKWVKTASSEYAAILKQQV